MTAFNKNSLRYKFRAWIIVLLGILQVLHCIAVLIKGKDIGSALFKIIGFEIVIVIIYTLGEIKADFEIIVEDGVIAEITGFVVTCVWLNFAFSIEVMIAVVAIEVLIILLGMLLLYWQDYKVSLMKKWKKLKKKRKIKKQQRKKDGCID